MKCEHCSEVNHNDNKYCTKCGKPLGYEVCPFCKKVVDSNEAYCESCNAYIKKNHSLCYNCNDEVNNEFEYCPNCGEDNDISLGYSKAIKIFDIISFTVFVVITIFMLIGSIIESRHVGFIDASWATLITIIYFISAYLVLRDMKLHKKTSARSSEADVTIYMNTNKIHIKYIFLIISFIIPNYIAYEVGFILIFGFMFSFPIIVVFAIKTVFYYLPNKNLKKYNLQ